ncbi:hypothetical protein [Dysosmobacter sp.]
MKTTVNFGLNLPEGTDYAAIETLNENARKLDAAVASGGSAAKEAPADNDSVVLLDSAAGNVQKRLLWSKIKAAFAPMTHSARHASGGADALSPADIGAAKSTYGILQAADLLAWAKQQSVGGAFLTDPAVTTSGLPVSGIWFDGSLWVSSVDNAWRLVVTNVATGATYVNVTSGGNWVGWKGPFATAADLAGYLPLAGGTLTGDLTVIASGSSGRVVLSNFASQMILRRLEDDNNFEDIILSDFATPRYLLKKNGVENTYKLYGEHNLPHPAQAVTGSYVGTGVYGADNPTVIPCGFSPKLLMVFGDYLESSRYTGGIGIFFGGSGLLISGGTIYGVNYFVGRREAGISYTGTGLSYFASDAGYQLNAAGKTYNWVAFA